MPQSSDEAFPEGFEECVRTLGQEPSVDDPEALCGWLQEHGFEAIQNANPDSILAGLQVEYVSVVDEPAQDSEWLLAKSAKAESPWRPGENRLTTADVLLSKAGATPVTVMDADADPSTDAADSDDETDGETDPQRKVWAAVLVPGRADAHGDLVPEPEIERAAHDYMKHYRKVDADHDLLDGEGVPIESYIIRNGPEEFTTPDGTTFEYPEGTWIMGVELAESAWTRVQNGDLTGFSIYGEAASLDPGALLTERQAKALLGARDDSDGLADATEDKQALLRLKDAVQSTHDSMRHVSKQLGADALSNLASAMRTFFNDNPEATVENTSLAEFFEWATDSDAPVADMDDSVEVGGVEIPVRNRDDTAENGESAENDDSDSETMNEEMEKVLGEIRDTTKSIAKSVEDLDDRVTALEQEGVSKNDEETDSEEGVVRKGAKFGTALDDVEKSEGDGKISLSFDGITEAGD